MKGTFQRNYPDHIVNLIKERLLQKHRVTDISKNLKVSRKFIYSIANNKAKKPRGRPKSFNKRS